MTPAFRYASLADAPGLVALIESAYRDPASAGQWDSESHLLTGPRTNLTEIRGLISRSDSRFIMGESQRRLVGCALIQKIDVDPAADKAPSAAGAYFGMFAIHPAIRAAGLGKRVLAEAETCARIDFGAASMVMTVINVRRQLIAWYQRRGYALTGRDVPFPFTEISGETTRDFHLVEMRKDF